MAAFFSREVRPLHPVFALGALAIGIALFCLVPLAAYDVHGNAGAMGLFFFLFTPLFGIPLGLVLLRYGRMRWWGFLYFAGWLTFVHYLATIVANMMYPQPCPFGPDPHLSTFAMCKEVYRVRGMRAAEAGLVGGLIGSAASYAGLLLFGPSFRSRQALLVMAASVAALGAIGAFGLSATVPEDKSFADYVWQLYVPWQGLFGLTLFWLFDPALFARRAA